MTYIELYFLIYKNESENENRKKKIKIKNNDHCIS